MERLISPIDDGGVPYLNQDFYQYLQQNHLTSYSAFLDEINDRTTGNCGIIIKGFSQSFGTVSVIDKDGNEIIETINVLDLQDSLVYLDGDFLEPAPWLLTELVATGDTGGQTYFTIVKVSDAKIRRYTKVYDFLTDVIEQNYFDILEGDSPQGKTKYIRFTGVGKYFEVGNLSEFSNITHLDYLKQEFPWGAKGIDTYLGPVQTPLGKNSNEPSTRWLSRILRYHMAEEGEIYMTYDLRFFDTSGIGFGEMLGFKLINYKIGGPDYTSLLGKYTIGFSTSSNSLITDLNGDQTIPEHLKHEQRNYSKTGNLGGLEKVTMYTQNVPTHKHGIGGSTNGPDNDMSHTHWLPTDIAFKASYDPTNQILPAAPATNWREIRFGKGVRISKKGQPRFDITTTPYNQPPYNQVVRRNGNYAFKLIPPFDTNTPDGLAPFTELYDVDPATGRGTETITNISDHNHSLTSEISIPPTLSVEPHENLPPTMNIAYYVKYDPYTDPSTPKRYWDKPI